MSGEPLANGLVEEGKRVGRNTAFLIGSRVAALALALLQTAIIGRSLGIEGSGQFLFALGYSSLFTVFATLGVQRVLVREISRSRENAWDLVWSATAMITVLTTLVLIVIWASTLCLVDEPAKRAAVVLAALSVVALWALQRPFEAVLVAHERMGWVAWENFASAVLKVIAIVIAFSLMDARWLPWGSAVAHGVIALANTAGFLLCMGFALYVGGLHTPRVRLGIILRQVRECIPLSLAVLFSLLYFKADIFLIERVLGDTGAGIYFPVQRLMEPLLMIVGLWGTAIFPALCRLSHVEPENYTALKQTSLRLAIVLAAPMAAGIIALAPWLVRLLVGPDALVGASAHMMQWYAAILPLFFFNGLAQEILYAAHRNWLVVTAYAAAAAIGITANLVLLPRVGYIGLSYAAIAANLTVGAFFVFGLHRELGGMRLPTLSLRVFAAAGLMGAAAYYIASWHFLLAVAAGVALYPPLLLALRVLNPLERQLLLGLLRRGPHNNNGGTNDE